VRNREARNLGPEWYDDEKFWSLYAPYIFGPDRWAAAPGEVDGMVSLLSLSEGSRVLDACCGVGRHSVELARRGCRVTGVDLNRDYLEAAAGTAEAEGVSVEFIPMNILDLTVEDSFDAAINVYTSFGYFASPADDRALLRKLHASLRPGGRLLVETMGKENLARDFVESEWYEKDDVFILAEYEILEDFGRLRNRWIIVEKERTHDYTFSHRLYSAGELKTLFTDAGFTEVRAYGSFDGAPYDHRARVLVVVGTKPGLAG